MFALYQAIRALTHGQPHSKETPEAMSYPAELREMLYLFESRLRGIRSELDALNPLSKTRSPSGSQAREKQDTAAGLYRQLLNCLLTLDTSLLPATAAFNDLLDMLDSQHMLMTALNASIRDLLYSKKLLPEGIYFESFILAPGANGNLSLMMEFRKRLYELTLTATREIPLELPAPTNIREARAFYNRALAQMKKHLAKLEDASEFSEDTQESARKAALEKKLQAFARTLSNSEQALLNKHWPSLKGSLLRSTL